MSDSTRCLAYPPLHQPISIELARALAEAADGYTGFGSPAYLVSPYVPVDQPFRGGFMVSGPYHRWEDVSDDLKCAVHDGLAGFFGPFDLGTAPVVHGRRVTRVDLHVEESPDVYQLPADRLDALFLSVAAVEKFAVPYYERIFGPDFARHVMEQFQTANVQVMAHFPWTEYTDGTGLLVRVPNVPTLLHPDGSGTAVFAPLHSGIPAVASSQVGAARDG